MMKRSRAAREEESSSSGADFLGRLDSLAAGAQVPFGLKAGESIVEIEDPTDTLRNNPQWPREDGVLAERVGGKIVNAAPKDEDFGPSYWQNRLEREKVLDQDPLYRWVTLLAGAMYVNPIQLYDAESVSNQRNYQAELQAINEHERKLILQGSKAAEERLQRDEVAKKLLQVEASTLAQETRTVQDFLQQLRFVFTPDQPELSVIHALWIGGQYEFLEELREMAYSKKSGVVYPVKDLKRRFQLLFQGDLVITNALANDYLARAIQFLLTHTRGNLPSTQVFDFFLLIHKHLFVRDYLAPELNVITKANFDLKNGQYQFAKGTWIPFDTTLLDLFKGTFDRLFALYQQARSIEAIFLDRKEEKAVVTEVLNSKEAELETAIRRLTDQYLLPGATSETRKELDVKIDTLFDELDKLQTRVSSSQQKALAFLQRSPKTLDPAELRRTLVKELSNNNLSLLQWLERRRSGSTVQEPSNLRRLELFAPATLNFTKVAGTDSLVALIAHWLYKSERGNIKVANVVGPDVLNLLQTRLPLLLLVAAFYLCAQAPLPITKIEKKKWTVTLILDKLFAALEYIIKTIPFQDANAIAEALEKDKSQAASFLRDSVELSFTFARDNLFDFVGSRADWVQAFVESHLVNNPAWFAPMADFEQLDIFDLALRIKEKSPDWKGKLNHDDENAEYTASEIRTDALPDFNDLYFPILMGPIMSAFLLVIRNVATGIRVDDDVLRSLLQLTTFDTSAAVSSSSSSPSKLISVIDSIVRSSTLKLYETLKVNEIEELRKYVASATTSSPLAKMLLYDQHPSLELLFNASFWVERLSGDRLQDMKKREVELEKAIQEARKSLKDVETATTPLSSEFEKRRNEVKNLYVPSSRWQSQPMMTGHFKLDAPVVAGMDEGLQLARRYIPTLADVTLDELTQCNPDSGLPGAFARLVAALINKAQLTHPVTYNKDIQYKLDPKRRKDALDGLKGYRVVRRPDGRYEAYRDTASATASSSSSVAFLGPHVSVAFF